MKTTTTAPRSGSDVIAGSTIVRLSSGINSVLVVYYLSVSLVVCPAICSQTNSKGDEGWDPNHHEAVTRTQQIQTHFGPESCQP